MTRRIELLVELDWPRGVTITRIKSFVREAVDMWGGQLEPPGSGEGLDTPGDPLFGCEKHTKVKNAHPYK